MADIVDRLRGFADLFEAQHAPGNLVLHMRAGADEIERKKAEIASLLNTLADTRTQNMRLRAALYGLVGRCMDDFNGGRKLRRGDVDRARAALEEGLT